MTATADFLATNDQADIAYVLLIEGLSIGFTDNPDLLEYDAATSLWSGALGDEEFTLYPGLKRQGRVARSIKLFEARIQPSSMTFSILDADDGLTGIFAGETLSSLMFGEARTDILRTHLRGSCDAGETILELDDVQSLDEPTRIYCGLETMDVVDIQDAENTIEVVRGVGSIFRTATGELLGRPHDVSYDAGARPAVTTKPTKWVNRGVGLYICHRANGVWSAGLPGTTANDAELHWAGRIKSWSEAGDGWIDIDCVEITEKLQTTIGASVYEGTLAEGAFISAGNEEFQIGVIGLDFDGGTIGLPGGPWPRYVTTFSFVGTRVTHEVAREALNALFNDAFNLNSGTYGPASLSMSLNDEGGDGHYVLRAVILTADDEQNWAVTVSMSREMWTLLGFSTTVHGNQRPGQLVVGTVTDITLGREGTYTWAVKADKLPRKFVQRVIGSPTGASELVVTPSTRQPFIPQSFIPIGFSPGTAGFLALRVGSEDRFVAVSQLDTDRFGITGEWRGAQKAKITGADHEPFVDAPIDGDPVEVRQVWIEPYDAAHNNGGIAGALLRLILSTGTNYLNEGTYDTLPPGFGAAMPGGLVDVESFLALGSFPYLLVILKPMPVVQLIESALNLTAAQAVWKDSLLTLVRPFEAVGDVELTESNKAKQLKPGELATVVTERTDVRRNPETIINRSTLRYQWLTNGTWDRQEVVNALASQSDHEQVRNANVDAYGIYDEGSAKSPAVMAWKASVAAVQLAYFSRPVAMATRSFDFSLAPKIYPGAGVIVYDDFMINPATGQRGVSGLRGWIVSAEWEGVGKLSYVFQPDAVTLEDVPRVVAFAPSARVDETHGVSTLLDTHTINIAGNVITTGATISGLSVTDVVVIKKPSVADALGMTWDAWSPWSADTSPPVIPANAGRPWTNSFRVANGAGTVIYEALAYLTYPSIADSLDALQDIAPISLTGETSYKFFWADSPQGDNRGGLSLLVEVYAASGTAGYDAGTRTLYFKPHEYSLPSDVVDIARFQAGDVVNIVDLSPTDPDAPVQWQRTIESVDAATNSAVLTVGLSSPAWPDRGHFVMEFAAIDDVQASQIQRGSFVADEVLRSTGNAPNDAYLWGGDPTGAPDSALLEQNQDYRRLNRLADDMGSAFSTHKLHETRDWVNTALAWHTRPVLLNLVFLQPATHVANGATSIVIVGPVLLPLYAGASRPLTVRVVAAMDSGTDGSCILRVWTSVAPPRDEQDFEEAVHDSGAEPVDIDVPETTTYAAYTADIDSPVIRPGPIPGCYFYIEAVPEDPANGQVNISGVLVMEAEPS